MKLASHRQYLDFFTLEMQRRLVQTKIYYTCLTQSKKKRLTNL